MRLKPVFLSLIAAGTLASAAPALAGSRIDTLMARARTAEAKGRLDDAAMLMEAAIVADPARVAGYMALAEFYARHHDAHFAHKYYDEALYLDPSLPEALAGAGQADLTLGDREAAEAKLKRLETVCGRDCKAAAPLKAALAAAGKSAKEDSAADASSLDKP